MEIGFFVKGVVIGLLASIPLGPIGVLCIQRTLSKKFKSGFFSGLGAAAADTLFATVAMFFLSIVMSFIESRMQLLTILGGIIIIVIGLSIFYKKTTFKRPGVRVIDNKLFKDFISVFFLTLTNPAYILVFVALFTTVGLDQHGSSLNVGLPVIIGVSIGASLWWFMLTFFISKIRDRFRPRHMLLINKLAGGIIVLLGIVAIFSAVFDLSGIENMINK